jgi:hypothetical protein
MKRVRYLAGAVGLAPAALGMTMATGTAHAATTTSDAATGAAATTLNAATGAAKRVSLRHLAPMSHQVAASSCTAHTSVQVFGTHQIMKFWHTNEANGLGCIGTVDDAESANTHTGIQFRVRVRSTSGTHDPLEFSRFYTAHGAGGTQLSVAAGVHKEFGQTYPHIEVCGAWVTSAGTLLSSPACGTVGR